MKKFVFETRFEILAQSEDDAYLMLAAAIMRMPNDKWPNTEGHICYAGTKFIKAKKATGG